MVNLTKGNKYGDSLNELNLSYSGIHVYLSYDKANSFCNEYGCKIIPVICLKEDVLAIDKEQAALRKIVIPEEFWPFKEKK